MSGRWSHRNHPEAIRRRQEMVRSLPYWQDQDEIIFDWGVDPEQLKKYHESFTGQMIFPVSIVGPMAISMGQYHVDGVDNVDQVIRQDDKVFVPLVHTEGGLSASMQRGIHAMNSSGGVYTQIISDVMTRDCAFVFASTSAAYALRKWLMAHRVLLQEWINDPNHPGKHTTLPTVSSHARLLDIQAIVVGPACHVLYQFYPGEACGPNMITRNAYALNQEILNRMPAKMDLPQHIYLEANLGGDKKPSYQYYHGGHGKTVNAHVTLNHVQLQRYLNISPEALERLEWVGLHGSHASGMQSFGFTPASAIAAIFAATGQDLGMVATSSMAHATIYREGDFVDFSIELSGVEVGTIGGGTSLPHAQSYLRMMGCEGPGSAQRLAQIIGGATLALELSAASAMASRGSENFFRAHLERGGMR